MADLYEGMAILALVSLFVLVATVRLTRSVTKREATAIGVVVALLLLCYVQFIWRSSILSEYLPYPSIVVLGNWFPFTAAFMAGITWTHGYGTKFRRVLFGGVLFATASYSVVSPILGESPACLDIWDENKVCLQTSNFTCTPAAAAMLLTWHGIPSEESEMAELCLTRRGTTWQGLYRGLLIKTRDSPYRVRVVECSFEELSDKLQGQAAILSVGIDPSKPYPKIFTEQWGWQAGIRHSVMLRSVMDDGRLSIADPAVGAELWTADVLEILYRGRFLVLEEIDQPVVSGSDLQN